MSSSPSLPPELLDLVGEFYAAPAELGEFTASAAADLPPVERELLAHESHMTVAVERRHGGPVDVRVHAVRRRGESYARKISLTRRSDGRVVLFGLVRLNFAFVDADVQAEIVSERIPLGRIMIAHRVLTEVHLDALWRIVPAAELRELLGTPPGAACYGRTAEIFFDGLPTVELLEIVPPA